MQTIRQSIIFKASAHEVYEELSAYAGYITGVNLELVPDKKIVQSWRGSDWPQGQYSKAIFSLEEIEEGTRLTFIQTEVPDEQYDEISQGWSDYYWTPMKRMLEK